MWLNSITLIVSHNWYVLGCDNSSVRPRSMESSRRDYRARWQRNHGEKSLSRRRIRQDHRSFDSHSSQRNPWHIHGVFRFAFNTSQFNLSSFINRLIFLIFIGHSFVGFFSNYGFEKMLRVAGRSFRHFLHSIDQLHDSNRYSFPSMKSPLFFVGAEDLHGCFLHYQ